VITQASRDVRVRPSWLTLAPSPQESPENFAGMTMDGGLARRFPGLSSIPAPSEIRRALVEKASRFFRRASLVEARPSMFTKKVPWRLSCGCGWRASAERALDEMSGRARDHTRPFGDATRSVAHLAPVTARATKLLLRERRQPSRWDRGNRPFAVFQAQDVGRESAEAPWNAGGRSS